MSESTCTIVFLLLLTPLDLPRIVFTGHWTWIIRHVVVAVVVVVVGIMGLFSILELLLHGGFFLSFRSAN